MAHVFGGENLKTEKDNWRMFRFGLIAGFILGQAFAFVFMSFVG
jgi:hypothetical protein